MKIPLNIIKTKYIIPIILLILGTVLLTIPSNKSQNEVLQNNNNLLTYSSDMENKIANLILKVDGITEASVMITLENSGEQVLAENKSPSASEYVIISNKNGNEGIKLTDTFPKVRGVAIVCTNGNDSQVKEKITSLVASALGISSNRITVVG